MKWTTMKLTALALAAAFSISAPAFAQGEGMALK